MSSQSVPQPQSPSAESSLWSFTRLPQQSPEVRPDSKKKKKPSLRLEPQAVGGQRVGVGFAQHNAVSEQFKKDIVVAAENKAQRQSVVPALGAQQGV